MLAGAAPHAILLLCRLAECTCCWSKHTRGGLCSASAACCLPLVDAPASTRSCRPDAAVVAAPAAPRQPQGRRQAASLQRRRRRRRAGVRGSVGRLRWLAGHACRCCRWARGASSVAGCLAPPLHGPSFHCSHSPADHLHGFCPPCPPHRLGRRGACAAQAAAPGQHAGAQGAGAAAARVAPHVSERGVVARPGRGRLGGVGGRDGYALCA